MDLTAEAIKRIQETFPDSVKTRFDRPNAEPAHVYYILTPGKEPQRMEAAPTPRKYTAYTLGGLAEVVSDLAGSERKPEEKTNAKVLVGPERVQALLDEGTRRETVTMALQMSEGFALLKNGGLRDVGQKELLLTLHRLFNNEVSPPHFVPGVKQLKFKANSEGESDVKMGRESMGKSVLREVVLPNGELPETVQLHVKVFENVPGFALAVTCVCQLDLEELTFTIQPIAGEVHQALAMGMEYITKELTGLLEEGIEIWPDAAATL